MITLALLLVGQTPSTPALPVNPRDFLGQYVRQNQYVRLELRLEKSGKAREIWSPDHAGGWDKSGTWSVSKGVLEVRLSEVPGSKATDEKFIPIVWGERVSLIQVDQIELYVEAELADRERIASGYYGSSENQSRYALARVDAKTSQPGKRFGKPIAPKEFQSLFVGLVYSGR